MGKLLVVFRGENKRWNGDRYHDVRKCIPNNKARIINSLRLMGHEVDIIFCTYDSEYINAFQSAYEPIKIYCMDYNGSSQHKNFKFTLDCIENHIDDYDKVIILRFDLLFKKNISEWPMWNQEGIMFPWKDNDLASYELRKYCQEVIISIDKAWYKEFKKLYDLTHEKWKDITWGLHFLTTELSLYGRIPFFFMEGDVCWCSNTSQMEPFCKNPYLINSIYRYYHDDYHLTQITDS
jgi:hypothetical protein